jgi:hypothetical protein
LRRASNEATPRAVRNADCFTPFKIFRRPGALRRRVAPGQSRRSDRIGRPNGAGKSTLFALLLGDVSPDNGTIAIEKNATMRFLPQETAFQVRERLSAFVGGNDEPVSIVAVHANITFDFVELKLDAVLHDG